MKKDLLGFVVGCFWVAQVHAATVYVDVDSTNPVSPYNSWATAATMIQDAVDAASSNDVVWVADGHYLLSSEILVGKDITIQSVNGAETTIVNGQGGCRCFNLGSSACLISGFTITNGDFYNQGGGVFCNRSTTPRIENCTVVGNHCGYGGGGIYYGSASNCVIRGNSSRSNGGGGTWYTEVDHCTISGNSGTIGGGMTGGTANNCTIVDNTANSSGGGAYNSILNNCIVSGNSAGDDAGGMNSGTANNCTITGNRAGKQGGGMYRGTANNCILFHNQPSDTHYTGGVNSCAPELTHGSNGNITNNPALVSSSHIATGSPCVGAGTNLYVSGTDIDGEAWQDPPSMGCDEKQAGETPTGEIALSLIGPTSVVKDYPAGYSLLVLGNVSEFSVDFGNGDAFTNTFAVDTMWSTTGNYNVVISSYNDDYPAGVTVTQTVSVMSAEDVVIHVAKTGNDANDGSKWAQAKATIQAGIDAQVYEGGIVRVGDGHYIPSDTIMIDKSLSLQSLNGADYTVIDGNDAHSCLNLKGSVCTVSGFTITNGYGTSHVYYGGGGVCCSDTTPVVEDCIIINNRTSSSYNGGGMLGGTAIRCLIANNTAGSKGGGIFLGIANNCIISGNAAGQYGGGVYSSTANNCVISGNTSGEGGGGMMYGTANNCTFTENTTDGVGGGIWSGTANNCILFHNLPGNAYSVGGFNSCAPELTHGSNGNITNNPVLVSSSHIATNSPCRAAGDPAYASGTDIDGDAWQTPPSMGCDEKVDGETPTGDITLSLIGPATVINDYSSRYAVQVLGNVSGFSVDFDNGTVATNQVWVSTQWSTAGSYDVVLTAYNADHPSGVIVTQVVTVVDADDVVVYVSKTGNDANDGAGWATAKATIQAGVDAQDYQGGLVLVGDGTYVPSATILISKEIILQSLNGAASTLIDGDDTRGCLSLEANSCIVSGFTITNGNASHSGGGINCSYGKTPIVEECIIVGNRARYYGGGIWNGTANNCTLSDNTAPEYGGGSYQSTLNNCRVVQNTAGNNGGGSYGGTLNNCLISGNSATNWGGGVYGVTMSNCTVVGNSAGVMSGGVYHSQVYNSIVWNNSAPNTPNRWSGDALYCCTPLLLGGTGNITSDPQFVSSTDFRLEEESPCINAGNNLYAPDGTDLAGNPRITGGTVDMGAYETPPPPSFIITTSAGANGSITPENPSVFQGDDQLFSIHPSVGYHAETLTVDGMLVPSAPSYTFTNVQTTHTIDATFVANMGTLYVNDSRPDDSGDGASWATAKKTIQAAVDMAYAGDLILVEDGTYNTGGAVMPSYALTNRVCITQSITVQSVNGPEFTIIQGAAGSNGGNDADSVRGVFMTNSCSLIGFTITDGYTSNTGADYFDQSGGGIWLTDGCVVSNCVLSGNFAARYEYAPGFGGGAFLYYGGTLEDCLFDGNAANYGGGAATWYGEGILRNCTLSNNSAEYDGGGVRLLRGGTLLTNCTLTGNSAGSEGGGAYVIDNGTLEHCTLSGNSANSAGGAALSRGGTLNDCTLSGNAAYGSSGGASLSYGGTMNRCLVIDNFAGQEQAGGVLLSNGGILNGCRITRNSALGSYGGGVYCSTGGTLNNCIVDYNSADSCGGVRLHNGSVMNNCVVSKNSANRYSGGIQAYYGDVYVNNSIVWSNMVGSSVIDFYGSSVTIHKRNTCASSGITHGSDGCITNNPVFVDTAEGYFNLQPGSPCIDTGNNSYAPAGVDYAGNPRIVNGTVDMGAYETPALPGFSITTSAGANGTITPGNPAVFQGYDQTFSIQPIVGYRVETLVVDGSPVSPARSYTFANVQATHTISVTFGVNASTLYVDDSRPDDSGDGASWATAKKTIQAAVDEVAAGGTVLVTNGIYSTGYTVTPEHTARNRVCITRAITVQSVNGPEGTVIQGQAGANGGHDFNSVRGVCMQNGCSLLGFSIRNGYTPEGHDRDEFDETGGGVWLTSGCVLSNCTITANSASHQGGGAYLYAGGTLNDCVLNGNDVDNDGGGAYLRQGGVLNDCILTENEAFNGGGASVDSGASGTLNNCLLSGNSAQGGGGLHYGTANGCVFTGNSATDGGGMQYGTANNCTFTFNSAKDNGGGFAWGTAQNCILWYNTAGESGNNLDDMDSPTLYSCSSDLVHGSSGNITNAPLMVSASHIAPNSPCIGAGSASYASGTDIDGEAWLSPPAMGCDEIAGTVVGPIQLSVSGPESVCENHATTYWIDVQGAVTQTVLDFDDGTLVTNAMLSVDHAWSSPGTYTITLTGYNDEFPGGVSTSLTVQVYSELASAIHVSPTGNNANDGTSWASAKETIQAGVDAQEITGGIVWVTNGAYSLSSRIEVDKAVRVMGLNGPESTVVDGSGAVQCFNLYDSECLISGFTITNGWADGSTPDGGWETDGGGVNCDGLTPVVSNCVFTGNAARSGGGMNEGTVKNSIFIGNAAMGNYGQGGGQYRGIVENCLLIENTATYYGGGAAYASLENCTVVNNTVTDGSGGGIRNSSADNCIVWGNTATSSGNNVYGGEAINTCSPDGVVHGVNGCITSDPLFMDGAAGNFQLLETSPCINAGNNLYAPDGTDLIGSPRIIAGTVDMGAYEYFVQSSFIITSTAGANGTISPIDPEVIQGDDQSFSIQPAYGYRVGSLIVDGSAVSATTNYTFTNVQSTHTIDALFTIDAYYADASQVDDSGDGLSWITAKQTIQAAVDLAADGGTVLVTNGTYAVGGSITPGYALNNRVCIIRPITVQSVNGPEVTLIQGEAGSNGGNDVDSVRGVFMENGGSLSGFTVTNGYSMGSGDFAMDQSGGGIWISSGCVVSNCLMTGNSATYGGGAYLFEGGTINTSTVRENAARFGGGVSFRSGGELNNCLLTKNSAEADGSGAYLWQGGTLNNCTLSLNFGSAYGGGAYLYYGGTLNNCIAWGNTAGYANDLIKIATGAVIRNTCASTGIEPGDVGCITDDPFFVDAANGDFQLSASSPCINSGDNLYATGSSDLAGNARINDGTVDMGAFENQLVRFLITTTPGANGLISPESPWVYQGGNQTFSIQPEFGYYIDSLDVDGSPVAIATNYTFTSVQATHTLAATFATDPHTLTVENGTGDGAYIIGTEVPLVADAPAVGYGFYEWTVVPEEYASHLTNQYTASTLFTMPESNVTITANYGLLETYADASRPDDSGDGTSWATAKKTIQAAVDTVGHNGTVWVADGTYSAGGAVTPGHLLMNRVSITRGITVRSMNGADVTVIYGADVMRCVFMASGTTLSGFMISGGNTLEFTGVEDAYFDRCGGGVFLQSGCEVSSCRLIGNTADYFGGGAHLHYGGALNNCAVVDNFSNYGGGVKINGGGTLNNCTISDNRAFFGGGLYMENGVLNNSIVWGNDAGTGKDMYLTGGNSIRYTCSSEGITDGVNGCIKSNPLFVDPVNDFRLQTTSPCIDGGDNAYLTTGTDLDGIPLPLDGDANGAAVVDIGCYEFVSADADSDGDHMNDRGEIIAGTNPLDPESYFHVTTDTTDGLPPHIIINWEAVTGRVYNVLWTPSLTEPFQPLEIGIQYPQSSYTDTVHTVESSGFYRVVVMLADYDSNGNGLPNDWEDEYGQSDPYADVDFDGFDNLSEFISGTDPTNGASFFTVGQTLAEVGGTNCFVVEWISIPDRLYSVQWSTNLTSGFQTLETDLEYPQNSYTDTTHNAESAGFYKIDVQLK